MIVTNTKGKSAVSQIESFNDWSDSELQWNDSVQKCKSIPSRVELAVGEKVFVFSNNKGAGMGGHSFPRPLPLSSSVKRGIACMRLFNEW